jgi:hypothetical protein
MTCVIEETEKNLLMMKTIFESFAHLSGLEINEGKTKVIRIGAKLDDNTPLTNKVKFIYANTFKLLGVNIDNKLKNLTDNFEARKKKIRTKIAIWRKLNLSEVGNLIISKTFMVSQLGYLLSMMSCPDKLLQTMQDDIDKFIFRTGKNPWMSDKRRYLPPTEGGMGCINLSIYANALRCSWFKRIGNGLWSEILMAKTDDVKNCIFIQTKDIHNLHISISPILKAFEALVLKFNEEYGETARMNTPLDQLKLIKRPATRTRKEEWSKPTKATHPFLYKKGKICELTGRMITTSESTYTANPVLKSNMELWEILGINNLHFLRKAEILHQLRKLFNNLIEGKNFSKKREPESLPILFSKVKKGSQKYRELLLLSKNTPSAPKIKIERDWKISEKPGREKFYEKAFGFWKSSCLPAKIQLMLLKIVNHNIKLNSQRKHYARDERGERIRPDCTFCTLSGEEILPEESYKHFFLLCRHTKSAIDTIATKYNIPIPNRETKGELILYYWPWEGKWEELRINIFYAISKYFLLSCRTRKILPTPQHFEAVLKIECKNIIMTTPTNKGLTDNLLPLWMGRELNEQEALNLLEEVEGRTDKGKLFNYSNKNTVVLKTQVHNNMRFPIVQRDYVEHRLNEKRNRDKIKKKMFDIPEPVVNNNLAVRMT